ncbi:hypothetical protein HDU97_010149 [Phlyctochytrium planicorne]|nr:hypothetical protein HDU97_010149 [Phlyctochytrium planicorne]
MELYEHLHSTPFRIPGPILPWTDGRRAELLAFVERRLVAGYSRKSGNPTSPAASISAFTGRPLAQPRRRKFPPANSGVSSGVGALGGAAAGQPALGRRSGIDDDGDVAMGDHESEGLSTSSGGEDFREAMEDLESHLSADEMKDAVEMPWGDEDPWLNIFRDGGRSKDATRQRLKRPATAGGASSSSMGLDASQKSDGFESPEDVEQEEEEDPDLPPEYQPSHRGKPCGHIFQVGEGVYWCRECAMDQTCVLCYRCFHATNHEGHETSFSVSQKAGGCCDCGDLEAWRKDLKCHYHSLSAKSHSVDQHHENEKPNEAVELIPVPENLKASMRATVSTILDFVIDTLSASPTNFSIPDSVDSVLSSNAPETAKERQLNATSAENGGGMLFACVIWNDELHSFTEVINRIANAARCSIAEAKTIANNVDTVGRDIVYTSHSIPRLISVAKSIAAAGLAVTIRSARETLREIIAGQLVIWLRDLVKNVHGERKKLVTTKTPAGESMTTVYIFESLAIVLRKIVCEELVSPRRKIREMLISRCDDIDTFSEGASWAGRRLRVDCLLSFDARLWKSLRTALRELYISTMIVSGEHFKKTLVQLFTVATIASHLVLKTELLQTVFSALKALFLTEVFPRQFQLGRFFSAFRLAYAVNLPHYYKLNCEGSLVYEKPRYMHLFYDIRYILTTHKVATEFFRRGDQSAFLKFLDLCCVTQGMNSQKRELRDHVSFESKGWINCFNLSLNIGRIIEYVGEAFGPTSKTLAKQDFDDFRRAFRSTLKSVDVWCAYEHMSECAFLEEILAAIAASSQPAASARPRAPPDGFRVSEYRAGLKFRVMEYRVLMRPVSLHNPLIWMMSMLLTFVPFYLKELEAQGSPAFSLWDLFDFEQDDAINAIASKGNQVVSSGEGWVPVKAVWASNGTITVSQQYQTRRDRMADEGEPEGEGDEDAYKGTLLIPDVDVADVLHAEGRDLASGGDNGDAFTGSGSIPPSSSGAFNASSLGTPGDAGGSATSSFECALPRPRPIPPDFRSLSREDRVSRFMDYILRVEVLLAQIRAGLWVRNGQIMRDQAMYFKYLSLRDLYDHGLLILQTGATLLGSDRFLTTLLERFELSLWFSGRIADAVKHSHLEQGTLECLAEEMLYLLVFLLTERARTSGMSIEMQIRRELVHVLALHANGLPHSKLAENVPERMSRTAASSRLAPPFESGDPFGPATACRTLDEILPEIATFKFPDGTTDTGMYILRDHLYEEVDPWFWHYNPTQRAEIDAILQKKVENRIGGKLGERGGMEALIAVASHVHSQQQESSASLPNLPSVEKWMPFASTLGMDEAALANKLGVKRPVIQHLSEFGGFSNLDSTIDGPVFCQLLFFCLHNVSFKVTKPPPGSFPSSSVTVGLNDKIMSVAVYLILVAVEIDIGRRRRLDGSSSLDGRGFLMNVGTTKMEFQDSSSTVHSFSLVDLLLHLLYRCSTEETFREYTDRLAYILTVVLWHGGDTAKRAIVAWSLKIRSTLSQQAQTEGANAQPVATLDEAKAEAAVRRKNAAKERQKAIMAQFAQQQKSFIEKYRNDEDFIHENMEVDEGNAQSSSSARRPSVSQGGEAIQSAATQDAMDQTTDTFPGSFPSPSRIKEAFEQQPSAPSPPSAQLDQKYERLWCPPTGNCIVCQEELSASAESPKAQYGVLGLIQTTFITRSRHLDLNNPHSVLAALAVGDSLDFERTAPLSTQELLHETSTATGTAQRRPSAPSGPPVIHSLMPPLQRKAEQGSLFVSSCGHLMHFACYDVYRTSVERRQLSQEYRSHPENLERFEFLCPLCKTIGNCIIPVFGGGQQIERANIMTTNKEGLEEWVFKRSVSVEDWWGHRGEAIVQNLISQLAAAAKQPIQIPPLENADPMIGSSSETNAAVEGGNGGGGVLSRFISVMTVDLLTRGRTIGDNAQTAADRESMRLVMAAANAGADSVASAGRRDDQIQGIMLRLIPTLNSLRRSILGVKDSDDDGNGAPTPAWFDFLQILSQAFSTTIAGLERAQRGGGSKRSSQLNVEILNQISPSNLTLLRVVADAILNFGSVIGNGWISTSLVTGMFRGVIGNYEMPQSSDFGMNLDGEQETKSIIGKSARFFLERDPFTVLVNLSFLNGSSRFWSETEDVFFAVHILWYAEIIRSALAFCENLILNKDGPLRSASVKKAAVGFMNSIVKGKDSRMAYDDLTLQEDSLLQYPDEVKSDLQSFLHRLLHECGLSPDEISVGLANLDPSVFLSLLESASLPFLRKCVLHLHGRHLIIPDFKDEDFDDFNDGDESSSPETTRLQAYLRLPSVLKICSMETFSNSFVSKLVQGWLAEVADPIRASLSSSSNPAVSSGPSSVESENLDPTRYSPYRPQDRALIQLDTPAVFELITLPKQLEVLFEECFRKTCVRCERLIANPALCLLCGALVCSQSVCCAQDKLGECNLHVRTCGGDVGVFFLVKTFRILFLNHEKGTYLDPPYLDSYGEVDLNLRKGRLQFLHQKRYDEVRRIWLQHVIPSHVARGIDAVGSLGMWTSF